MQGNKNYLSAKIIEISKVGGKIRQNILLNLIPLFLGIPRRIHFKSLSQWGNRNETTYHHWFQRDLELLQFNTDLVQTHGSGDHFMILDPSFINKSGKKTPSKGNFWSGGAGQVKSGLELTAFAVGDLKDHTAYHLTSLLTPNPSTLKAEGKTLIDFYVSRVTALQAEIKRFGNCLVADAYFGVETFVRPVMALGIDVISCFKSNTALYYVPKPVEGCRKRGRPALKDGKIDFENPDNERFPIVEQTAQKRVRSAIVYVTCMKIQVLLVAVEYLKADGTLKTRKLYFGTRKNVDYRFVLRRYQCRFQIEFLFRDGKQFTGLMHCQSTDEVKLNNHFNLSLTAISVAKVAHWQKDQPFSMKDISEYYHNLQMIELFSEALGLDPNAVQKNPKILNILLSKSCEKEAA
jgi:Transposase DDE domain